MADARDRPDGPDGTDPAALVADYYRALDGHDYESLASILAPEFTQRRPDRTFEGRDAFVRFMREERPLTDTSHEVREVFADAGGERALARGRLLDGDGERLFGFADVFTLEGDALAALETYTR
ncbi:nuclear transport factor 2 family protein [Natronobiforma cellulositropha]|uniref:nuclear transport factor 2 family protein n=1 Tax=Natronobiforma cellulositropha TaxID=1679076 RepID=UPI0021D5C93D|nr:nuclear transport factor 2 family protein [Natronobiforma cellulositropha]